MESIKRNGLNGNQLKILGTILMVFDHLGAFLILETPIWFGWLGRPVAIIFLFLSAEGFKYTKNKFKYASILLGGFWIMSFGNWFFGNYFPVNDIELYANIFGTLFFGILYMFLWDLFVLQVKRKNWLKIFAVILLMLVPFIESLLVFQLLDVSSTVAILLLKVVPTLLVTEGGLLYVVMALLFYIFKEIKWVKYGVICSFAVFALLTALSSGQNIFFEGYEWIAVFSLIPIFLYNDKKGNGSKYFFYIFYPAHIFIIYMISYFIQVYKL